jgi:hypothetical protein
MKIGLLLVCTGKYSVFFNTLYDSCEKFFLPNHEKTYYVFTDGEIYDRENIVKIHQPYMGFPNDTLKRYHLFTKEYLKLIKEDYLFFLNANMLCVSEIGDEILPNEENDGLMAVHHPGFYKSDPSRFTYERNPKSQFYISVGDGKYYYQGCFNGGKSKEFLEMSKILADLIDIDQSNDILPIWWDESALNWYLKDKNPLLVNPGYSYPEGWSIPFDMKMIQRDKNKFGGYNFLRQI